MHELRFESPSPYPLSPNVLYWLNLMSEGGVEGGDGITLREAMS